MLALVDPPVVLEPVEVPVVVEFPVEEVLGTITPLYDVDPVRLLADELLAGVVVCLADEEDDPSDVDT